MYAWVFQVSSFPQVSPPKLLKRFCSSTYVPHPYVTYFVRSASRKHVRAQDNIKWTRGHTCMSSLWFEYVFSTFERSKASVSLDRAETDGQFVTPCVDHTITRSWGSSVGVVISVGGLNIWIQFLGAASGIYLQSQQQKMWVPNMFLNENHGVERSRRESKHLPSSRAGVKVL